MLQSVALVENEAAFNQLIERHRTRLLAVKEARSAARGPLKQFLDGYFYASDGRERRIARGRAGLKNIQRLLQAAVDEGLIAPPVSGAGLRQWLKTYGVGVDCSGFVQQVLERLLQAERAEPAPVPPGSAGPHAPVAFLRCPWVYASVTEIIKDSDHLFAEIPLPALARPGDILVNRSHMRIVVASEPGPDGGLVLVLAESTSGSDVPAGHIVEEPDIGPRIIRVLYPQPVLPISAQSPLRKRQSDEDYLEEKTEKTYAIGRYRDLAE
jgi:hypothetical protein